MFWTISLGVSLCPTRLFLLMRASELPGSSVYPKQESTQGLEGLQALLERWARGGLHHCLLHQIGAGTWGAPRVHEDRSKPYGERGPHGQGVRNTYGHLVLVT